MIINTKHLIICLLLMVSSPIITLELFNMGIIYGKIGGIASLIFLVELSLSALILLNIEGSKDAKKNKNTQMIKNV